MPFADIDTPKEGQTGTFRKLEFLRVVQGQTFIRILDEKPVKFYTHYINGITVQCLDEDCPICVNNKKIIVENPETFREVKGYSTCRAVHYVNILDRTPVKICSNCKSEVRKANNIYPASCSNCNAMLLTEQEIVLNKVKVLNKGNELFNQFNALESSVIDNDGNPLPITAYDIVLSATGSGRTMKITPVPLPMRNDVVNIKAEAVFDLSHAVIELTAEEINDVLRGVSLKDVFAARRASKEIEEVPVEIKISEELQKEVEASVANILG